ncbi:MAG: bifunctional folylpolyglutamate synthase/dihydrofolate synthase, partial [Albidovulum sp.]
AAADSLTAVSIPGEANTLSADETQSAAANAGIKADTASSVLAAVTAIAGRAPTARILVCGSLYLAGVVLRENG